MDQWLRLSAFQVRMHLWRVRLFVLYAPLDIFVPVTGLTSQAFARQDPIECRWIRWAACCARLARSHSRLALLISRIACPVLLAGYVGYKVWVIWRPLPSVLPDISAVMALISLVKLRTSHRQASSPPPAVLPMSNMILLVVVGTCAAEELLYPIKIGQNAVLVISALPVPLQSCPLWAVQCR